jgi:hypothetical protein
MTPKQYAAEGAAWAFAVNSIPVGVGPGAVPPGAPQAAGLVSLANDFKRGGRLDAQQGQGGEVIVGYGNYTYGVFMQSAGFSLDDTLMAASAYGLYQSVTTNAYANVKDKAGPLGSIPARNVNNIVDGYNAAQSGNLSCS